MTERLRTGKLDGLAALRDGEQIGDYGDGSGLAAGSVTGEDDVAAELAADDDHVLRAMRPGDGRGERHQHGRYAGVNGRAVDLRTRDLADGAAQLLRVGEVDGVDSGDGLGGDSVGIELGVESDAREDAEFGAGVVAVDVGGRIGLGVAELLRVGEDGGVVSAGLHAAEDVVAGAVDDAAEAGDLCRRRDPAGCRG